MGVMAVAERREGVHLKSYEAEMMKSGRGKSDRDDAQSSQLNKGSGNLG